jgi:hypothetical protein
MSLRTAVAVPFRASGGDRMTESEFVVALSLDRDWFSPDQAKRLVDVAASEGLVSREGDDLVVELDVGDVSVPEGFHPDESIIQKRSTFERVLDAIVDAGTDKQDAVADVNRLQADLGVTLETAAVVYARRAGVDVTDLAERVRTEL